MQSPPGSHSSIDQLFHVDSNYAEPDAIHQADAKQTVKEFLQKTMCGRYGAMVEEFNKIKDYRNKMATYYAFIENETLNRYVDIKCMDQTRVELQDGGPRDYINANFVDGYKQKKAFICCQGPLKDTCGDFWRMIWQEQVLTICMLTKVIENKTDKCAEYWPVDESKQVKYDDFVITNRRKVMSMTYTFTQLAIQNTKTKEKRAVTHLLFVAWPDFGVPKDSADFLSFIKVVRRCQIDAIKKYKKWKGNPRGPPIVVHCSAGVGRTGTLVCTDICISSILDCSKVDVSETVKKIRTQRDHSVQRPEQYYFINVAVMDFLTSGQCKEFEAMKADLVIECSKDAKNENY